MATPAGPDLFNFATRLGIVFIVESASLSALAVSSLLLYIIFNAIMTRKWPMETHTHYYFINLLVSDLVQAIGGIFSVRWVVEAEVTEGAYCTAQGMLKQMGDVGVALTTLTIALHTLLVLVFHLRTRAEIALIIIATIWVFIGLDVGIGAGTHREYYGNTQYWCWITGHFPGQRIGLEYLWLWLTCFGNIVIYVFLALVIKGYILVENKKIRIPRNSERKAARFTNSRGDHKSSNNVALNMLFYPAVYIVTTLPVAVVRWMAFNGHDVPFAATAFASVLFSSSGILNVILYALTRPKLLPTRPSASVFTNASASDFQKTGLSRSFRRDESDDYTWEVPQPLQIEVHSTKVVEVAQPQRSVIRPSTTGWTSRYQAGSGSPSSREKSYVNI